MSEDGDITSLFKSHRKSVQTRHTLNHLRNTRLLEEAGIEYRKASNETYCFRGKVKVDFFPSTGRWRDLKRQRTHSGGARMFIQWFIKMGISGKAGPG